MPSEQTPSNDPFQAQREALRAIKAVWEKAVRENNLDLIQPHLAAKFSIVTFTNKEFTDFAVFKAQWAKTREAMLQGGTYSVELLPDPSDFVADLAICHGDSSNDLVTGGKTYSFGSRWTVICRKEGADGAWKIVRAHSSINPFDNPLLMAGFKKKALLLAFWALLVGLIVGGIVGYAYAHPTVTVHQT